MHRGVFLLPLFHFISKSCFWVGRPSRTAFDVVQAGQGQPGDSLLGERKALWTHSPNGCLQTRCRVVCIEDMATQDRLASDTVSNPEMLHRGGVFQSWLFQMTKQGTCSYKERVIQYCVLFIMFLCLFHYTFKFFINNTFSILDTVLQNLQDH